MFELPPVINDITTDLDDPPRLTVLRAVPRFAGADLSWPPRFGAAQRRAYPDLGPLHLDMPPEEALATVVAVARAQPRWVISRIDARTFEVEGVARTRWWRFVDDFSIRVRPEGQGSRVDMRSRSRIGRSDLGENARRIRSFWRALRA